MGYPPLHGTPTVLLGSFLDSYRDGITHALDALTDEQAAARVLPATDLSVAGIVVHLAHMEDHWFSARFAGEQLREPWATAPYDEDPDWDFHSGADLGVDRARELYGEACARSRAIADGVDLDVLAAVPSFGVGPVSLGWVYVHMLEETAHHAGHIDLLRDALTR